MRKYSKSYAKISMFDIGLFLVLAALIVFFGVQRINSARAQQLPPTPESMQLPLPPIGDRNLFFVEDHVSLTAAHIADLNLLSEQAQVVAADRLIQFSNRVKFNESGTLDTITPLEEHAETGGDGGTVITDNLPSPDGQSLIVQTWNGGTPFAFLLSIKNRSQSQLIPLTPEGHGIVLAWHPDSRYILYNVRDLNVPDPGLWLVDTWGGTHRRLEIPDLVTPQGLLAASFSPDGSRIVYVTTRGMGFGSEVWTMDVNGTDRRLIRKDEERTVSGVTW